MQNVLTEKNGLIKNPVSILNLFLNESLIVVFDTSLNMKGKVCNL